MPPGQPAYAMPLPAGYPVYGAPAARPRFADQVLGMRAVVAVALACLIVGGLSGLLLGRVSGQSQQGFGQGPGGFAFQQRGAFPRGNGQGRFAFPRQRLNQGHSSGGR